MVKRNIPPHLQYLSSQIPDHVMGKLPNWELGPRLLYAHGLLAEAEHLPPDEAARTQSHAMRVLFAAPVDEYLKELARLDGELLAAAGAEDFEGAGRVFACLLEFQALNPQIPEEAMEAMMPATASELRERNRMASRALNLPKGRRLGRR